MKQTRVVWLSNPANLGTQHITANWTLNGSCALWSPIFKSIMSLITYLFKVLWVKMQATILSLQINTVNTNQPTSNRNETTASNWSRDNGMCTLPGWGASTRWRTNFSLAIPGVVLTALHSLFHIISKRRIDNLLSIKTGFPGKL